LREMFDSLPLQKATDDLHQSEYFCDDSAYPRSPASTAATPPYKSPPNNSMINASVGSASGSVSSAQSSTYRAGSIESTRQPVLYSAIASLEDPTTNSLSRHTSKNKKCDFPSTALLLKPMNSIKSKGKKASPKPSTGSTTFTPRMSSKKTPKIGSTPTSQLSRATPLQKKLSNLRRPKISSFDGVDQTGTSSVDDTKKLPAAKTVTISAEARTQKRENKGPVEMFRPSSDAYTPRMGKKQIKYKPAEMRTPVQTMASPLGTLSRPNFRDALRRVAMILHQHVAKIERRFENRDLLQSDNLFDESMKERFSEERFATPSYKCTMVRVPMARGGMVYGLKRIRKKYEIPSEGEIYEFAHKLFQSVQLSSECSIVCLIYVERLMEASKVPLLASTWRPIFMCGLLLASKVWQDLSSWNIEFANVYPQFSLEAINRLEIEFLRMIKWDLYIYSSCYAKYYFALRSLVEKPDFRQRYNRMVGGVDTDALKIEKRSSQMKENAILQLSRSM
jgi:hypothetical protein